MATVARTPRHRSLASIPLAVSVVSDRYHLIVPPSAFTLSGFRAWVKADGFPERVRVAFLDGEIYLDMSNEELETHVAVKGEIGRVLSTLVRDSKLGKYYGDGVLVTNEAANVSNNPDALFLSWETIDSRRVQLIPREGEEGQYTEIEGRPDWVLEVVSDSSVRKDTRRLREAYHRAGIPEYWLIDARGEEIAFQILHRRKNGYAAAPLREGWQRSRVFGRNFRLVREHDRAGMWEYTLETRAD
jgi:Uma2 family endonuclease